jgi:hypothetical protein
MSDEPKIIVDEDWKSRVAAEKEAVAGHPTEKPTAPAATKGAAPEPSRPAQLPPASLSMLITTLATQAMMALGELPNPLTGKTEQRLPEAQHFIDMLAMLEDKTADHRTPDETALLDGFLHQLRLAYVELSSRPAAS